MNNKPSRRPSTNHQIDVQDLIYRLLPALQNLPISRLLPSWTRGTLRGDLLRLESSLESGDFDFERVRPLLQAVVANKPDEEIWTQVYHAVTEHASPPRPIASRPNEAPSSFNMGSTVNSSECRIDTDDVLKEDLGPMYVDIPLFHEAFFGRIPELERTSRAIFDKCCEGSDPFFSKGWTGWPGDADESTVLVWLQNLIQQLMRWAQAHGQMPIPRRGLLAEPHRPLGRSMAKRKLDVAIVSRPEALADWSQILIPGELKSSPKEDRKNGAWFDIGNYVREVLAAQDTRRFVLAFTLCGSLMRVWEFDRLGGIASARFDINEDGLQFVSTILGFLWMGDKDLGFDPTFVSSNNRQHIEIIRDGIPERVVIDKVIGRVPCISGRATTCWKAHPEKNPTKTLVVKDSWQCPERNVEGELLREVTEKGVCNVATYYHHETVHVDGSVDDVKYGIRRGLDVTKASNYHPQGLDTHDISQVSQGSTAGRKRSSSQTSSQVPSSKRPRLESPTRVHQVHGGVPENRIHRRVIVRDYGQNIYKASSPAALLAAFEDCIQGHKSLLRKANILHRDISINNLMINEDDGNPSRHGFLIDLDLANREEREGAEGAEGAREKIGTKAFMAIGVLQGKQHSFMHDLESFFWVLFWICIHYNGPDEKSRVVPEFDRWNYINLHQLAVLKLGYALTEDFFIETLTQNCTSYYEPLIPWVNRLRQVLFDNSRQGEDETLYSRMREVLREAQEDRKVISEARS